MCGIVGIYNNSEAANLAYLCLHAVQHRGQESCGIATSDGKELRHHKAMGLVGDIFTRETLDRLPGTNSIGHTRYSTSGSSTIINSQPFVIHYAGGWLSIAHNGNLTNAQVLRAQLEASGSIFQSTMDSEVVVHLIAAQDAKKPLSERITHALRQVEGAYALVFLSEDHLIAARDPNGFRPMVLGRVGDTYVVASETCQLDLIEATYERDVEPGEMIVIGPKGMQSSRLAITSRRSQCIFEYIYFARPDSHIYGRDVYKMRVGLGAQLSREHGVEADVVCPVPDSGTPAAIGYAQESGIPFQLGLIRNHYIGRTFIEPEQSIRHFGVKLKLNPVREVLAGKRVILVDDSIMRGTTSMKIVKMVRAAGAKEVHLRISAPPTKWPCFYGIDIPTREELIAANKSIEEMRNFIGADSLSFLSHDGLYWFDKQSNNEWFCDACFTGNYPLDVKDNPELMVEAKSVAASNS